MVQAKELDAAARCVAFDHAGLLLAVGLGKGGAKATRDGAIMIFQAADLSIMNEPRDSQEWVRELAFSPVARFVAAAPVVRGRGWGGGQAAAAARPFCCRAAVAQPPFAADDA